MNAAPVSAVAFGFVKVILSTEVVVATMLAGANDLATPTWLSTVSVPVVAVVVAAFAAVIEPVLLTRLAALALVTLTVMSQLAFAGTLPPVSVSDAPPAAAVTLPLQPAPLIAAAGVAVFLRLPG